MATRINRTPAAKKVVRTPGGKPTPKKTAQPPRVTIEYVLIDDLAPYEFNARDNAEAIPAVKRSIQEFGFLVPCVIDQDNVLVTGHTRVEASKLLGIEEIPCLRASHLTEEQIKAFRLIDNKTSEIATWDHDLLAQELSDIIGSGSSINFTEFGWTQEAIDCLSDAVTADCLEGAEQANQQVAAQSNVRERRAPATARIVIGEIVFFVEAAIYRQWVDGIRQLHDYNDTNIVNDLKSRLGIHE